MSEQNFKYSIHFKVAVPAILILGIILGIVFKSYTVFALFTVIGFFVMVLVLVYIEDNMKE